MMGRLTGGQEKLFYSFSLEDHIPRDHLLRGIDSHLDLSDLRRHLSEYYSHTGRPSIDPELMMRMLIIGYCVFRRNPATHSEVIRPPVPTLSGHPFRWNSATL